MRKLIIKLTGLKFIGSLIGLVYSILQVRLFGASAEMDAYFVAMTAVSTITSLIQGGQLAEVYLPEYLKQKSRFGFKAAHTLLSAILNRMVFFVIIILLGLYYAAPTILSLIGPGLAPEFQELGVTLFSLSLILIFFTLIGSFVNTTLNAEQIFGRKEVTGIINGIISIGVLVEYSSSLGVYSLIIALLTGKIVEFIIGLIFLKKIGFKYRLVWKSPQYDVSDFFRVMFMTTGYVGATQLYKITMTAMASFLPAGSLSIFNYVTQLSSKASSILMGPISTVFFSKFTAMVSEGKKDLEIYLKQPLTYIFSFAFIIFCYIFLSGEELLRLLWTKRSLNASEFSIAYLILCFNFFGFLFSSTGSVFRKTSIALGNAKMMYQGWILVQLFSAAYAFISINYFGIYGLATVLVINMILMAGVSFLTSERSGIKSRAIVMEMISKKRIYFLGGLFISLVIIFSIFHFFDLGNVVELITKVVVLSFVILLFFLGFYGTYIRNSFQKVIKR